LTKFHVLYMYNLYPYQQWFGMRTGPLSLSWLPPPSRVVARFATKSRIPLSSPVLLPPLISSPEDWSGSIYAG
jgi:hypothetical protein